MACNTPIIFLIYRRPDLTAKVFEAIRQAKPTKLFVIADGPRNEAEISICSQTRAVIDKVNWDCDLFLNYSDFNLGCRKRVSSGISWAFEQIEEAIILEDDCLPHASFFKYCSSLLDRYRDDHRIWSICGHNFQKGQHRGTGSYYFSKYPDPWGWATWRRAWKHYDPDLADWENFSRQSLTQFIFEDPLEINYWNQLLDRLYYEGIPNTWDYQWMYCCWKNSGLSIWPNLNLVSNIGCREDGTFCTSENSWSNINLQEIDKIIHPKFVVVDKIADRYYFYHRQPGLSLLKQGRWQSRFKQRLLQLRDQLVHPLQKSN